MVAGENMKWDRIFNTLKKELWGFPGGAVVENLPANARGHGFEHWSGRIPRAAEQLGPWATITEPACLEPVLRNKRGRESERPTHRDKSGPHLPQLEEALAQKRRPNTAINK